MAYRMHSDICAHRVSQRHYHIKKIKVGGKQFLMAENLVDPYWSSLIDVIQYLYGLKRVLVIQIVCFSQ